RGAHGAFTDAALGGKSARAETVGEEHDEARGGEPLAPIAIAPRDRSRTAGEPGASVQRDDRRERAIARRAIDVGLEPDRALRNLDEFRRRCGGPGHSQHRDDHRERAHDAQVHAVHQAIPLTRRDVKTCGQRVTNWWVSQPRVSHYVAASVRFRSSPYLTARSDANFGIEGH